MTEKLDVAAIITELRLWVDFLEEHQSTPKLPLSNIRNIAKAALSLKACKPPPLDLNNSLNKFLTTRSRSIERESVLSGAFYVDHGRFHFSMLDWLDYIVKSGSAKPKYTAMTRTVRLRHGDKIYLRFKGTGNRGQDEGRNLWWVPASTVPNQPTSQDS